MVRYKIGQPYKAETLIPETFKMGQRVEIKDAGVKVAAFVIETIEGRELAGKIVNTYGHKRVRHNG